MPEEAKQAFSIDFGKVHISVTVALVAALASGFYAGVKWVTTTEERTHRNQSSIQELRQEITGLQGVIEAQNERENSHFSALSAQLDQMHQDYRDVGRLQERYDNAFATYQPQPKRGKHR